MTNNRYAKKESLTKRLMINDFAEFMKDVNGCRKVWPIRKISKQNLS